MRSFRKVAVFQGGGNSHTWSAGNLINLNIVSLRLHTHLIAEPPLLETLLESLFWIGVSLGCCCSRNFLSLLKPLSYQWSLDFGEYSQVTGSHIRRVRSVANQRSLVFCQKSLNQVQRMCRSIIGMEMLKAF